LTRAEIRLRIEDGKWSGVPATPWLTYFTAFVGGGKKAQSCPWVGLTYGLGWVGLGRDF